MSKEVCVHMWKSSTLTGVSGRVRRHVVLHNRKRLLPHWRSYVGAP